MSMALVRRLAIGVTASTVLIAGLIGAYSYGQAYSRHRGFASVPQLPRAGTGRLLNVNFYSQALHREAYYLVYLPPGYKAAARYPVLYLLHGMPGRPQVFIDIANMDVRLDNQLRRGHVQPMILVFPDGRIGGSTYSDSEWANTPSGNFESYVVNVVHDVDHRFATLASRQDRAIAGFSAGAYGAINIALHHLGVFGSVEVWSGYFIETGTGVFAHASRATLAYDSPLDYVTKLRHALSTDPLRAFMFVGRADGSRSQLTPMVRALRARGASAHYAVYPGGHDWQVWYPRLNQMLIIASRDFARPLHAPGRGAVSALRAKPAARLIRTAPPGRHRAGRRSTRRAARPVGRRARRRAARPVGRRARRRAARRRNRHRQLIGSLILAIGSAATINLGFLVQHRAFARAPTGRGPLSTALHSRTWIAGQALGWVGFGAQIAALAIGPISLVQAFAAGGLAISVPLAAGIFRHHVSRVQVIAVLLIAASLATLPLALGPSHGQMRTGALIASALIALAVALAIGLRRLANLRAIAAGVSYGVADAAIKAVSIDWRAHGAGALLSGWTVLALAATFGGFLAFQAALRTGDAVSAISLMTALTALLALGFGAFAFGESLGAGPLAVAGHLLAIALVLACVPLLATAQRQIAAEHGQLVAA